MSQSVLRPKGQITLPAEIRAALHVNEGDAVEFTLTDDGVLLRGLKTIPADQAWFWTARWHEGEREASAEIARGEGNRYESAERFLASLD